MSSLSKLSYGERASRHQHPVAKRFFQTAEAKQSNLIVSADFNTTGELLKCADSKYHVSRMISYARLIKTPALGPYMAVLKTHVDLIKGFSVETVKGLKSLSSKHSFMIFEDREFVDIGNAVQQQYHGGALRISEFADIVNVSVLGGEGIIEALSQSCRQARIPV